MLDKRSFSFITETHKYYCPSMFWEGEEKEKAATEKAKAVAKRPKNDVVPPERKKELDLLEPKKEKVKGKGWLLPKVPYLPPPEEEGED